MMRPFVRFIVVLSLLLWTTMALAQPAEAPPAEASSSAEAPPPPPAPVSPPAPASAAEPSPAAAPAAADLDPDEPPPITKETKQEAKRHFLKGLKLLREEAWAPALAEFKVSREFFPTRVATKNTAVTLRKLQRYDEALDMYETMLRDFKVSDAEKEVAQREIAELRSLVGTVEIVGAEPGVTMIISGIERGEFPSVKPLRIAAGSHLVRVFKEGFEPFEANVDVAGGRTALVEVVMGKLSDSGRLRVTERSGKKVELLIDNVAVGHTPWQGVLAVGSHMLALRGEGTLGTQPVGALVKSQELASLTLLAEPLNASLRVNPSPAGASVRIDGVNVGNGVWLGRLKTGKHQVEVRADGFETVKREMNLSKGQRGVLNVELERDDDAPVWRKPAKWTVDLAATALLVPSLGGDLADSCEEDCSSSLGVGGLGLLHVGYELGSGLGFGIEAGYLIATKGVNDRRAQLVPNGLPDNPLTGTAEDSLRLQGLVAGATVGYHLGEQFPIVLRVGAGVMHGELKDGRNGQFTDRNGDRVEAYPLADFPSATYFYVDPMVRGGIRLGEHIELSASVRALLLFALRQPRWDNRIELAAGADGIATYSDETLMGSFTALIAPGLDVRYTF